VTAATLSVVKAVVADHWRHPADVADTLEVLGILGVLNAAGAQGALEQVREELFQVRYFLAHHREVRVRLSDKSKGDAHERGDVDAAGFAGRAAAIAGGRAVHGAGNVRTNHDFASDCRYVLYGGFHRILQRVADFKRYLFGCCLIRGQQLVRQNAGAADGGFVTQFFCHHFDVFAFCKHIVAQECVQVLANLLP